MIGVFLRMNFMKNKLHNPLDKHMPLIVGMHFLKFFTLEDFPYESNFDIL